MILCKAHAKTGGHRGQQEQQQATG